LEDWYKASKGIIDITGINDALFHFSGLAFVAASASAEQAIPPFQLQKNWTKRNFVAIDPSINHKNKAEYSDLC
jgi:hypothetical protein